MGIDVLSLFDGVSCGQIALERAGIEVDNYFASEIDKWAIKVTQNNYPNTIQLGSITEWESWVIPKIDLIIGGSPCQSISNLGDGSGLDGKSSLFFAYLECLRKFDPTYFLLENVVGNKKSIETISQMVGVEPILINSNLVSGQNTVKKGYASIDPIKANCITARSDASWNSNYVTRNDEITKLTPVEYERLQTVPDNYTSGVSNSQRYKMLGNGWTVDVIAHILKDIS